MTDILLTIVNEYHAAWIATNAEELVKDNIADNELRPNKTMYGVLAIMLVLRTGADLDVARKAIEAAADKIAEERELQHDKEWISE